MSAKAARKMLVKLTIEEMSAFHRRECQLSPVELTVTATVVTSMIASTSTTRCQFHQQIMYKFFVQTLLWQIFYVHVTKEKLLKQRTYKKFVRKMLMTLTTAAVDGGSRCSLGNEKFQRKLVLSYFLLLILCEVKLAKRQI